MLPQDLTALFNFFGTAVGINGFGFGEREQEDPERAKRLVDGLEEVPVGLVRRLGRVGGGGLEGEEGASGGDSGCAICWDSLLNGGDGWGNKEKETKQESADNATTVEAGTTETGTDTHSSIEPSTSADTVVGSSLSASSSKAPESGAQDTTSKSEPEFPKIVALPCAHVFHASCLIPWFSRPRQTTCPTCRFNIDPENLTYVRRRRAAAAGNNNAGNNPNAAGADLAQPPLPQGGIDAQQTPPVVRIQMPPFPNAVPTPAAGAGGAPNPMNGLPQIFINPNQIRQASADVLATRADLAEAFASAQAARDNPALPGDPSGLGSMAAATAAMRRAEAGIARVEEWLGSMGTNANANAGSGAGVENNGANGEIFFF